MSVTRRDFAKLSASLTVGSCLGMVPAAFGTGVEAQRRIPLGVAVIGLGDSGRRHLSAYRQIPGVLIRAICDFNRQRLIDFSNNLRASGFGDPPRAVSDYHRILRDPGIDAISLGVPWAESCSIAAEACRRGKDVFIGPFFPTNTREARKLAETTAGTDGAVLHEVEHRFSPAVREGIRFLRDGGVGDVRLARARVGVEWDLDVLDVARWGLGVELPVSVSSSGNRSFFERNHRVSWTTRLLSYTFLRPDGSDCTLILEVHRIPENGESSPNPAGGPVTFYGTEGRAIISRSGFRTFLGTKREPGPSRFETGNPIGAFVQVSRNKEKLRWGAPEPREIYMTWMLSRVGQVSLNTEQPLDFDPDEERFPTKTDLNCLL